MAAFTTTSVTISATPLPPCPPQLIPNLPDDISLQILARVPRFYHPFLSLVAKSWRSAVKSPELFCIRSLLRTSQFSLYLSLRIDSALQWYSEQKNPQVRKRSLIPLPSIPDHLVGSSILALGPRIYVIGGSIDDIPSNNVWIFDCRFNTWEMGPKMRVAREFCAAGERNGKIFVMGGCNVDNWARSINWAEVFDPETGLWASVPSAIEVRDKWMHASAMIGSKFYAMADRGGVVYDVGSGEWGNVPKRLDLGWRGRAAVVDGVLYCYDYLGKIRGYDVGTDVWKELRGMEKDLPKVLCSSTMVNLDGKLCVVWEGKGKGNEVDVMCAEIEVRRDVDGGLSGAVLWVDVILVVPKGASISHCLAVEF
ncbi:F-box/kelch-repeat protein skip6 [Phtheirospermum japonicum]|uniref:F-box/kelch-repeat protein skip6 n=1 Tax=Phtheirospermum japonicum TaxID=374723 RepID=A0A830CGB8_9LAMI|nr:F-box/kelch-repeat protein skip6 [Phtheirospermum japonicum]